MSEQKERCKDMIAGESAGVAVNGSVSVMIAILVEKICAMYKMKK